MLNDYKYNMIIANGAAGTGKTLLACQSAIKELYDGNKDKIIITRPSSSCGRRDRIFARKFKSENGSMDKTDNGYI